MACGKGGLSVEGGTQAGLASTCGVRTSMPFECPLEKKSLRLQLTK